MSSAQNIYVKAYTKAFHLFTESDSGKQSRLTATIPILVFGMLFKFIFKNHPFFI